MYSDRVGYVVYIIHTYILEKEKNLVILAGMFVLFLQFVLILQE